VINAVSTILVGLVASGVLLASYINRRQAKQRQADEQLAAQAD